MPIKRRGNGLEVSVQVTRNGDKQRHREIVHCTMKEAEAHEAQVRADMLAGRTPSKFSTGGASKGITLEEALSATYDRYWKNGANARGQQGSIKLCLKFFGADTCIDKITSEDADQFIAMLTAKDLAASTIRQRAGTMTKMFNHYYRRGNIDSKPYFELPKIGDNTRDRVISYEEETELLRLFQEDYSGAIQRRTRQGDDFEDLFAFLMDVGCRPEEARNIHVRNWHGDRLTLKITKTELSRTLPLTQRAKEALQRQAHRNGDHPFAWATSAVIRHGWDWARANMGLSEDPGFIPYALRHTCATRLYDKTRDIMIVQKWLGHKTIQTTLRYAKLQPYDLDRARDLLEAA